MKKLLSFFILFNLLLSNVAIVSADNKEYNSELYPYFFRNFFPQEDAKVVTLKDTAAGAKSTFSIGTNGEDAYIFNNIAVHLENGNTTPGYNPQSYTIFPQDYQGLFGPLTIHIRNFDYPDSMMDKVRPVISIEYRDENNSPMYTALKNGNTTIFNPLAYSTYGMNGVLNGTLSDVENDNTSGTWYRIGNGSEQSGKYSMDIKLPMDKLSLWNQYYDKQLQSVVEDTGKILHKKLKYIKVKISLVSLEQPDGSSFLDCQLLRPNQLKGEDSLSSFGGKEKQSDSSNLYFQNGSKYEIVTPVTLGEDIYRGNGYSKRIDFSNKVNSIINEKNSLDNMEYHAYSSEFPKTLNAMGNKIGDTSQYTENQTPSQLINGIYLIKGNFAIEDCAQLSIKSTTDKYKNHRPEYIGVDSSHQSYTENNLGYTDGIDCKSEIGDIYIIGCNDGIDGNDSIIYRPYAPGAGFGYEPKNFNTGYFNSHSAVFPYNIGISGLTPTDLIASKGFDTQTAIAESNKLLPPKLTGSYFSYDWVNEKPIFSKLSYSANLTTESKKKKISSLKNYCESSDVLSLFMGEGGFTTQPAGGTGAALLNCLLIHGIITDGPIKYSEFNNGNVRILNELKEANVRAFNGKVFDLLDETKDLDVKIYLYSKVLDIYAAENNDNYGDAIDKITLVSGKNRSSDTFSQMQNLIDAMSGGNGTAGSYARGEKFYSTNPYNVVNHVKLINTIRKKSESLSNYTEEKALIDFPQLDSSKIDESFQWQTFYPFTNDVANQYKEKAAGTKKFAYNMSLLKGTKDFVLGTYDLDKDVNGGNPNLDIDIVIRPSYTNTTQKSNTEAYQSYGPQMIRIDGKFTPGIDDGVSDRITIGKIPLYTETIDLKNSKVDYFRPVSIAGDGAGRFDKLIDPYTGENKAVYIFNGPEGNNSSTFYKVNLQSLYTKLMSSWSEQDKKYLKDWAFDEKGALKESVSLRAVIDNPDLTAGGTNYANVIYLYSNAIIGNLPKQLPEQTKYSTNLELIESNKKLFPGINGYLSDYYTETENHLMPRNSDTVSDENTLITTYRLNSDDVNDNGNNTIVNPYLIEQLQLGNGINIESKDFSADEITELKKTKILDKEISSLEGLGKATKVNNQEISLSGSSYTKTCISPTNQLSYSAKDKDGNIIEDKIPYQYVCYYIKDAKYTESELISDPTLRILSAKNEDFLPFVDITTKYVTKKSSDLTKVSNSLYTYSILNSAYKSIMINENGIKRGMDLPETYNDLVDSSTKDSELVKRNAERLSDAKEKERFPYVDYTTDENSFTDTQKKLRVNIPLFVYFDTIKNGTTVLNYSDVAEYQKINNWNVNVKTNIGDGDFSIGNPIKATWDYTKTSGDNNNSLIPNPDDGYTSAVINKKKVGDDVIAYPKIINTSGKQVCDLKVGYDKIENISPINNGDNQLISDSDVNYVKSDSPYGSGETIWINGTIKRDLDNLKDFKYRYQLDGVTNNYSYKVKYKFCGEEAGPYKETISQPISFQVDGTSSLGGGICNLNDTTPAGGTQLYRGGDIDYKISCFNSTGKDIYNLKIKLPLPDGVTFKEGISDDWIQLGSLNAGQKIDFSTNPLDMIKKTSVSDEAAVNKNIIGHLDYQYTQTENGSTPQIGFDEISHLVVANSKDQTTIEVLRGSCSGRNDYSYNPNPASQQYPFKVSGGMCSAKIPKSDDTGNLSYDNDNKSCLVVRYYRTASDSKINNGAYPNVNADLYWGKRTNHNDLGGQCSSKNSTSSIEGTVRSKYINTKVHLDVDIPNGYILDGSETAFTDYNASIDGLSKTTLDAINKKYNYSIGISSSSEDASSVNSNNFQNVLKDGKSDIANLYSLSNALVELRIPLKAVEKGNSVQDGMKAKVDNSYITFDRKVWDQFDSPSSCQALRKCSSGPNATCWIYSRTVSNDGYSVERYYITNTNQSFPIAEPDETPVCISSDGKWMQVLNGGMYVKDLSNMTDNEHQIDINNPASYNVNWFYNQDTSVGTPNGFMKYGGDSNQLLNMDTVFTTDKCYEVNSQTNDYDYTKSYYPTNSEHTCKDGTIPWFYSIIKGNYGYLYQFTKQQLKDISSSTLNISKDYDKNVKIDDRVWLYERKKYNEDLVIGKDNIPQISIIGKGGIFVTNDVLNLQDKTAVLNINSNVVYQNNQIKTTDKINNFDGDALAIVVNGNLKISSKVTKLEGLYFVDGNVYIEESKNQIEIDRLYVTGNIYIKRKATVNSTNDKYTKVQDAPIFRVKGSTRYLYIQPKLIQELKKYYKENEVPANNLNIDCIENGLCQ